MDQQAASTPEDIWRLAFYRVQRAIDVPTVWIAMEAAKPLALEGNHLIVGMPSDVLYLALNLQTHEYATIIDDALQEVAGRPLALHIVEGESLDAYRAQQALDAKYTGAKAAAPAPPTEDASVTAAAPSSQTPPAAPAAPTRPYAPQEAVETIASWDKLNERLTVAFKRAPLAKYPHGQAAFLLHAVKLISATMDHFMDAPFGEADPAQDRALAKCIERLGVTVSLDPLFISLELVRYRRDQGKDIGAIPPA